MSGACHTPAAGQRVRAYEAQASYHLRVSSTVRPPTEPRRERPQTHTDEPSLDDVGQPYARGERAPGRGQAAPFVIPTEAASAPELDDESQHHGSQHADRELSPELPSPEAGRPESEPPLVDPFAQPRSHPTALAPSRRLSVLISLIALSTALAAVGVLGWGAHRWTTLAERDAQEQEEDEGKTRRARMGSKEKAAEEPEPPVDAPPRTVTHDEGGVTVVDLGIDAPSLDDALKQQLATAERAGQTLLLMLTGRRCDPCRGVDASLGDPRMQKALAGVRLVRVDLEVFGEELSLLNLPVDLYPSFFLLRPDLTPIDAIHGGEWDADIPVNIAPVLGPFVRGEYDTRRHPEWAPTTTGIEL